MKEKIEQILNKMERFIPVVGAVLIFLFWSGWANYGMAILIFLVGMVYGYRKGLRKDQSLTIDLT